MLGGEDFLFVGDLGITRDHVGCQRRNVSNDRQCIARQEDWNPERQRDKHEGKREDHDRIPHVGWQTDPFTDFS